MVNPAPRILSGRYEVGELIGRGGMAEVHIGHDSRLGRTIAIKILRSDLARDPSFQARFRREAQAAASLNHPAIVAVYDTGEDTVTEPTGAVSHVPFIVMEYVEGHTVRDILRDGSAVPIEEALEITAGVLSALEYSHHAGIVHRDIKPANVMLTPTGAVKVMDFGIARALADSAATMTQTQAVIGTAQYLSPEQARGDQVDARSDLYSTGCLLYELLTGRPPFQGDSPVAVAYQHVREIPRPPSQVAPDVPAILDAITLRALEKDRNDRYATAAEFRAAIEAAARGEAPETTVLPTAAPVPVGAPATQVMPQMAASVPEPVPAWQTAVAEESLLPDVEEEEPSKSKYLWILLTILLVGALVFAGVKLLGNNEPKIPTVTMPVLTGLTQDQAKASLISADFTEAPEVSHDNSIDIPKGIFISSTPNAGQAVPANTVVKLVFSNGPSGTTVPDVIDKDQNAARALLKEHNLDVLEVISENSPDIKQGNVTRSDPAPGDPVPEGTQVTLYISDGYVMVPDITKAGSIDEAKKMLTDLKLVPVMKDEETDDVPVGKIVRQSPEPGVARQGAEVSIYIAVKPPPVMVTIVDMFNVSQSSAENWLRESGLVPKVVPEFNSDLAAGQVIRTEPGKNKEVEEGSTVTLFVSKGAEPTQEPTPDPTTQEPPVEDPNNPPADG